MCKSWLWAALGDACFKLMASPTEFIGLDSDGRQECRPRQAKRRRPAPLSPPTETVIRTSHITHISTHYVHVVLGPGHQTFPVLELRVEKARKGRKEAKERSGKRAKELPGIYPISFKEKH